MTDRIVDTEFEAAEVLANLFSSTAEASVGGGGGAGESVDSWGSRTKRWSSVRVKSEPSPVDSAVNSTPEVVLEDEVGKDKEEQTPVVLAFDLNEDQAVKLNQLEECQREPKDLVKIEDAELAQPSPSFTSRTGRKLRQNLTEADKEAKKFRRVLANRESARQTIRRRQALYEELTRKVADLGRENENLKKEKESAAEDYQALKCTNKKLNEQVAEQLGIKQEENVGKSTSAKCSVPALPFPNYPFICKDKPFVCPYNIQLPDMRLQLGHYGFAHQSEANVSYTSNSKSPIGKGKPLSVHGPSGQWCMVPYPLFFPMPDVKNEPNLIRFFSAGDKENDMYVENQHTGTSSSKFVSCSKDLPSEYPVHVKTEAFTSVEDQVEKTNYEIPLGLSIDAVNQQVRSQSKLVMDTSSLKSCTRQSDVRGAVGLKPIIASNFEAISSKGIHDFNVLQEPAIKHGGKRLVDPAVAAEARKRRKELTKMKSMHCRAHRKEGLILGETHPSV